MTEIEVIKTQMDKWFDELLKATGESGDAGRAYELVSQRYGILLYEEAAQRQRHHMAFSEHQVVLQTEAMQKMAKALEAYANL